ncbi:MAG: LamG-like jellyroll fold domain-containing protein [Bacteroidota bacterium]|nr:LamG-like jellyroll fold domain-containing protein [Bacteroidota bacterium]MDP4248928.1 LamG-like jellyroll fold domain-containing protein [Bacteroidota bacterium]
MKTRNLKFSMSMIGIAILVAGMLPSCSKKSSSGPTGPGDTTVILLGGYASSDSVAPSDLIAYWPFDGNANDAKGGLTATTTGATFTAGLRKQAYQGAAGAYATLTPGTAFSSLSSFSVSVWYNLPALPVAGEPGGMFFLSGATPAQDGNLIILEADVPSPSQVGTDSVKIHHGFTDPGSPNYKGFTMESYDTNAVAKWEHIVMTYDAGSSTYVFYQNGVPIGVNSAWSSGGYVTPTTMYDGPLPLGSGSPATALLGAINFTSDPPTNIIIGTWPAGLYGVSSSLGAHGSFLGQMDDLRVYDKALSQGEVAGLYLNGKVGR